MRSRGMRSVVRMAEKAAVLLLGLLCAGCGRHPSEKVVVVATIPDLADWVRNVGGERVRVTSLLTGGEEPHSYEPKPTDVQMVAQARLLVRVGLGLEEWLDGLIANANNPKLRVVTIGDEIDVLDDRHAEHGHAHAAGNPHIWLDPENGRAAVGLIAGALAQIDSAGQAYYRQQAGRYSAKLDSATRVLRQVVAGLGRRKFVAVHESWPYFCRRFGFEAVAALEPLPGQEPSARSLAQLAARMKAESVRVIVVEPHHNRDVAAALARETGARVVVLSSITGGLPGTDSYLKLLDYDVRTLARALSEGR